MSELEQSAGLERSELANDGNWQLTEQLLETLNGELGSLKEYVLTELRGEITTLRSEKLQLQSRIQELRHEQDILVTERQHAQQQEWAQQFAQVLAQNFQQEIEAQGLNLSNAEGALVDPEHHLGLLRQNMASLEGNLADAIGSVQRELGLHQSELSQQLLRMQDLEQQGEMLLEALVAKLKQGSAESFPITTDVCVPPSSSQEPGALQENLESFAHPAQPVVAPVMARSGEPTDVASVMAAMPSLQQLNPGADASPQRDSSEDKAEELPKESTSAAAIPMPPRLTVPTAKTSSPAVAGDRQDRVSAPMMGGTTDEGDEAFIAEFPIGAVKPGAGSVPRASAVSPASLRASAPPEPMSPVVDSIPKSSSVLADMPELSALGQSQSKIVSPPGMQDSWQAAGDAAGGHELSAGGSAFISESGSVSPWQGEPPTTINSLTDLTGDRGGSMPLHDLATVPVGPISPSRAAPSALPSLAETKVTLPPSVETARLPEREQQRRSGIMIAAFALLCAVLQYVILQVLFHGGPGLAAEQGLIAPTWGSALVTFWIRMLMVLPFMIVIGQGLYPPLIQEMQGVFRDRDPIPLLSITASGLFFFLAHFLLYGAIATSSATPAVALFLLYPAVGQFLGWGLFNQQLNQSRLLATAILALGILLLLGQWGAAGGRVAGLSSGLFFALYLMLTAVNGRRMHPMTLTVIQFGLAWLCSMPALLVLPQAAPLNDIGYVLACMFLSLMVVLNQLLGLASRRRLGAGLMAALQGLLPLFLGLFGLFLTHELLRPGQILAVLLVAGGAVTLGLERMSRDRLR